MTFLWLILGFLALAVGHIMVLVAAYKTSLMWFLICFFIGFPADLIFAIMNWDEAKKGFIVEAGAIPVIVLALLSTAAMKPNGSPSPDYEMPQASANAAAPSYADGASSAGASPGYVTQLTQDVLAGRQQFLGDVKDAERVYAEQSSPSSLYEASVQADQAEAAAAFLDAARQAPPPDAEAAADE